MCEACNKKQKKKLFPFYWKEERDFYNIKTNKIKRRKNGSQSQKTFMTNISKQERANLRKTVYTPLV